MKNIKLDLSLLRKVVGELNERIIRNQITNISVINSTDILFHFYPNTKERLLVSLAHQSPLISLVGKDYSSPTLLGSLSDNLRKNLKSTHIEKIEILNNDRIVKFSLSKMNDYYEIEQSNLILELIPTKTNLVIADKEDKIIYAYHYTDLTHVHPIVRGIKYELVNKNSSYKEGESISIKEYREYAQLYLVEADSKRRKEKQKPLYNHLVTKRKSLTKKIDVLNNEKEIAESKLIYREYGEMIYALLYDKEQLDEYIKLNLLDLYDFELSPEKNASKIFDKYRKAKRSIEYINSEIEKAKQEIDDITNIINTFSYLDDDELIELNEKYMYKGISKQRKSKVDSRLPFYVTINNTIIGFGKNAIQNNYLTFKKAGENHLFLHIDQYSGSHVVIFSDKPTNEEMLLGAEICLIMSGKESGDIKYTQIKDVKKSQKDGQVNLLNYKLITLREVRKETYELLLFNKRFTN